MISTWWWSMQKRIHVSWIVATFAGSIVVGVAIASAWNFNSISWLLVGLVSLVFAAWRGRRWVVPIVIVGGVCVGLWRGSVDQTAMSIYSSIIHEVHEVRGSVRNDAGVTGSGLQSLELEILSVDGHDETGQIWVTTARQATIQRGDIVTMSGKIQEGFGIYGASMYRTEIIKIERPNPGDLGVRFRDWFSDGVRVAVQEPQASLGLGFLTGQRSALPESLDEALIIAGLTHIVVASGYNLTILVRFARRSFVRISKYLATLAGGMMIAGFVMITGFSPSMSRAALVTGLSLVAWYYGRRFHPIVLLAIVAAITVLIKPYYVWGDLGWYLSFAAFAGVMLFAPLLQRYFFGSAQPSGARQLLGETVAAQIATLPIVAVAFGVVSNVALVANLLVVPLIPLAMLLTFIAGIAGLAIPNLAHIVGWPAEQLLGYMVRISELLASLPWAQNDVVIPVWVGVGAYAILVSTGIYMYRVTRYRFDDSSIID